MMVMMMRTLTGAAAAAAAAMALAVAAIAGTPLPRKLSSHNAKQASFGKQQDDC
jgi:hypothetical protein